MRRNLQRCLLPLGVGLPIAALLTLIVFLIATHPPAPGPEPTLGPETTPTREAERAPRAPEAVAVAVVVEYPGANTETVEQTVAAPLEPVLAALPGVRTVETRIR